MARADDVVEIRWYAVPNNDTRRGGWMPVYDLNGHQHGDTWGRGFEIDVALKHAEADARAEAAHYCGDWKISVEPRDPVPEPIPAYETEPTKVEPFELMADHKFEHRSRR